MNTHSLARSILPLLMLSLTAVACAPAAQPTPATPAAEPNAGNLQGTSLTVYSGRTEDLVGPIIEQFRDATGIDVRVRYGDTAELGAAILEEGANAPADVYFAQDAGALGALSARNRLAKLPTSLLDRVDAEFRSPRSEWVGISGRARTVVYNTATLEAADLPGSVTGLTDPRWRGAIGWAPTNGSFQAFVTAMRKLDGEDATRAWLEAMKANGVRDYRNNTSIVEAVARGEIEAGLVNHYYLHRFLKEQGPAYPARNYHPREGGAGAMVNVAGAAILDTARNKEGAQRFVEFMLSQQAQEYFANQTNEYPLASGVPLREGLVPLDQLQTPALDVSELTDLEGTLRLLQQAGVL